MVVEEPKHYQKKKKQQSKEVNNNLSVQDSIYFIKKKHAYVRLSNILVLNGVF